MDFKLSWYTAHRVNSPKAAHLFKLGLIAMKMPSTSSTVVHRILSSSDLTTAPDVANSGGVRFWLPDFPTSVCQVPGTRYSELLLGTLGHL